MPKYNKNEFEKGLKFLLQKCETDPTTGCKIYKGGRNYKQLIPLMYAGIALFGEFDKETHEIAECHHCMVHNLNVKGRDNKRVCLNANHIRLVTKNEANKQRFYAQTTKIGECIIHSRSSINFRENGKLIKPSVAQVAYMYAHGLDRMPHGISIHNTCTHTCCINLNHLTMKNGSDRYKDDVGSRIVDDDGNLLPVHQAKLSTFTPEQQSHWNNRMEAILEKKTTNEHGCWYPKSKAARFWFMDKYPYQYARAVWTHLKGEHPCERYLNPCTFEASCFNPDHIEWDSMSQVKKRQ